MSVMELIENSTEYNPTIFSVFMSGMLHKMSIWENITYSLIIFLSSLANFLCLVIVSKSTVFHTNLQFPILWTMFSYFELAISKLLIIAFQIVYLEKDCKATGGDELIRWSALLHYLFLFTVMCSPIVIVVERSLATLLLFDYEKKKRRSLLITLFLFQNAFGGFFTYITIANFLRYVPGGILAGVIATGSLLVFLHLNKVNRVTLNFVECYNRDVKFDLSVRYQLRENVKTFKMLKNLLITFTGMIVILAFFKTVPMITSIDEDTKYAFRLISDLMVHAGPIYVTITIILAVQDYRRMFFRLMGISYDKSQVIPKIDKKEEDVYFEQFLASLK